MERVLKTEYGLMAVRIVFYFTASVILAWFFTDYYASQNPVLVPLINMIQLKSYLEIAIYLCLFLIIFLPALLRLSNVKNDLRESCESGMLLQKLLGKITDIHNNRLNINNSLTYFLENIGVDLDLDRVYIYKHNENTKALNIITQWVAEDTNPLSKIQQLEIFQYPIFNKWLNENIPVYIIDVNNISDQNTKNLLLGRNAKSILVIPLIPVPGVHFLLFLESSRLRKWSGSDISFIQSISQIVANALERFENGETISRLSNLKIHFIELLNSQLKGPLQSVKQNVNGLLNLKSSNLDDTQKKVLNIISETNLNLSNKISDLLSLLDYESGHVDLVKTEVDLIKLVDQEFSNLVQLCLLKEQKPILYKPTATNLKSFIDQNKIAKVIQIFIKNASEYSHKYGEIQVKIEATDTAYIFSVQDQGIGIPISDQDKIFQPFFRSQNAKEMKTDSPGTDLFVAKSIINAHQGNIGFNSKEGDGSYFWFTLPKT